MVYKPFDENSAATRADKCTTYTETGINSYSGSEKQQLADCRTSWIVQANYPKI